MGKIFDKQEAFLKYFNELEGFTLRSERFYFDCDIDDPQKRSQMLLKWMKAAFNAGCEAMASDTIDTLGDYGTALAGIEEPKVTKTEAFDMAAENLKPYYDQIFKD
jgi:hypothetical protein